MTDTNKETDNYDNTEELLNVCAELKRGLSRLSFVGMGLSEELDKQLASLRSIIKKEGDLKEIKGAIDRISKILRTLDDNEDNKEIANVDKRLDLLSQLLNKQLPKPLKKQLKQVQKKSPSDDSNIVIRSIANVIESYIASVETDLLSAKKMQSSSEYPSTEKKKKGFFSWLFSKKEKKEDIKNQLHNDNLNKQTAQIISSKNDHHLPQKVRDSLQLLVDQLSSMDGYSEIADLLNEEIEKINKIEQLSAILEMITGAFIEVSDQEHVQFEKFLKTLNSRIVRVNDFISQTLSFSKETNQDSQQLNLDLSGNISDIKDTLSNSETIGEAKDAVFLHMDNIINRINRFCEKQENNSDVLVSQMDKLSEQLRATEDEATRLKDDLAEQRVRAQTDPLTHLPNRYSYNERLTQEYNRWRRYRHPLTLVIGDIDLFKRVNDDHGHAFGDKVLKTIAAFLGDSIRESDFVARFGGEEFVLLLPETAIVDATRAMNKIRSGICKLEIMHEKENIPVTISFGISEFESNDTTKAVFERADKALYRAKEKGRNKVCCQRSKTTG